MLSELCIARRFSRPLAGTIFSSIVTPAKGWDSRQRLPQSAGTCVRTQIEKLSSSVRFLA
jgi:hypothetical protein